MSTVVILHPGMPLPIYRKPQPLRIVISNTKLIIVQAIRAVVSVKLTPSALEAAREAGEQKLKIDDFELSYSTKGT